MAGKERRISERSLENLKLGPTRRYQGKVRQNFTILPETLEWLRCSSNASSMIDDLVALAKNGGIRTTHIHQGQGNDQLTSNNSYECKPPEVEQLKLQLAVLSDENARLKEQLDDQAEKAGQWYDKAKQLQGEIELLETQQLPDLEAERDRFLAGLRCGKQAPEYKRTKATIDRFIGEVRNTQLIR